MCSINYALVSIMWPGRPKAWRVIRLFLTQSRQKSRTQANLFPFLYWEVCITGMSA